MQLQSIPSVMGLSGEKETHKTAEDEDGVGHASQDGLAENVPVAHGGHGDD